MGKLVIQTLDLRHAYNRSFKYRVQIINRSVSERIDRFVELRNWCWNTFGPAAERDMEYFDNNWAWHAERDTDYSKIFIYFASDRELSLFKLKWM
jgi:hypothetical protein